MTANINWIEIINELNPVQTPFLINVGQGTVPDTIQDSIIPLPADMCCSSIFHLRNFIYDYFHDHFHDRLYLDSKSVLASTNESVE